MMHATRHTASARLAFKLALALGATVAASQVMAAGPTASDAQEQYQRDVQRCNSGQTAQDEKTCLREAGAALQEARRNRLVRGDASFDQNRRARCDQYSGTQREDCLQLMSDPNPETMGSVEGGGVLRRTTITVPGDTAAPGGYPPAPAPSSAPTAGPSTAPAPSAAPAPSTGPAPTYSPSTATTPAPTTTPPASPSTVPAPTTTSPTDPSTIPPSTTTTPSPANSPSGTTAPTGAPMTSPSAGPTQSPNSLPDNAPARSNSGEFR